MVIGMGLSLYEGDMEIGQEYKIGTVTISGTTYDRYVKTVKCDALPNNTSKSVAHGITYVGVLNMSGMVRRSSDNTAYGIPRTWGSGTPTYYVDLYMDSTYIYIADNYNLTAFDNTYVTIEYYR